MGEQSAVVWKRLYLSPFAASRSAFGVSIGPPKALEAPKPTSSIRTMRTFGAPSGGRSGSIGGNVVAGSLASYVVSPTGGDVGNRQDVALQLRSLGHGCLLVDVHHRQPASLRHFRGPSAPEAWAQTAKLTGDVAIQISVPRNTR